MTVIETPAPMSHPARGGTSWAQRERPAGATGRLTFDGVLRSEWIKLLSLRSIRWSLGLVLLLNWAGAATIAWAVTAAETLSAESAPFVLVQSAALGTAFTVLIMGVFGVLAVTSEYSSGMILSTFAAVPRRRPVLAAKALAVAALALVVGALSIFGAAGIAALILGETAHQALATAPVLLSLTGSTLYLVLAALFSLGVGSLIRTTAGSITVVVTVFFILTIAMQMLTMTGWEWVPAVAEWLPSELGSTLAYAPIDVVSGGSVTYWGALGGLVAWAAAVMVPAFVSVTQRDAV